MNNKALTLSYCGLIPFVGLTVLICFVSAELQPFVALALTGYGAAILAFLGGIHWGLAIKSDVEHKVFHFVWGVIPAIAAWICVIMPAYAALPLLGILLIVCYLVDKKTWPLLGLQDWLHLRLLLTIGASLSCFVAAGVV